MPIPPTFSGAWGPFHDVAGAALAATVTGADISPGGTTNPKALAGGPYGLTLGSHLELRAFGSISTAAASQGTLVIGFYWGGLAGVLLAGTTTSFTPAASAANWTWTMTYTGVVRSTGSAGTILGSGFLNHPTSLVATTPRTIPEVALATVTIDTTVQKPVTVAATWGSATAGNTITCHDLLVLTHG